MDRRTFLKNSTAALSVAAPVLSGNKASAMQSKASLPQLSRDRVNVVFILSDQHNAKVMGHMGHPDVKTPHLDRMAAEGVRFNACISQNPICTPSRVSFLSGQYCHNHGYFGLSGPNPNGLPTLLGYFRQHGYRTAAFGKIHCPEMWVERDSDVFHDTTGTSVEGRSPAYAAYLKERGLTELEDHVALAEFGKRGVQAVDARPSKISYQDSQEGWCVAQTIAFMEDAKRRKQNFFVHLSLPKPHQCYAPAQEFWDMYEQDKLTLPPNIDYDMSLKSPHLIEASQDWKTSDRWILFEPKTFEAARRRKLHGYLGCISHVDYAVGQVLDWLRNSGLADKTVVVYSSDHGDYACEHNIMEKAPGICSDAITRVPMLWWSPGRFKAGHVVKEVVETVDVAATLPLLAGLAPLETADGRDLSKQLAGAVGDPDRTGLTEFSWSKSLRMGKWRLVYYPTEMFADQYPQGFGELYDLENDPWEMKNLYFEKDYQPIVRTMREKLLEKLIVTKRPVTFLGSYATANDGPQQRQIYGHSVNADNKMHPDRIRLTIQNKDLINKELIRYL